MNSRNKKISSGKIHQDRKSHKKDFHCLIVHCLLLVFWKNAFFENSAIKNQLLATENVHDCLRFIRRQLDISVTNILLQ